MDEARPFYKAVQLCFVLHGSRMAKATQDAGGRICFFVSKSSPQGVYDGGDLGRCSRLQAQVHLHKGDYLGNSAQRINSPRQQFRSAV
jgi:hypothetical protein